MRKISILYVSIVTAVLISTQACASMGAQEEAQAPRTAAVQGAVELEKRAYWDGINIAFKANDRKVELFCYHLKTWEAAEWFSYRALDSAFKEAGKQDCLSIIEYLLGRTQGVQLSADCIGSVFTMTSNDKTKLAILNDLIQKVPGTPLLTQAALDDLLPKAAARGQLELVQRIINLPQDRFTFSDACRLSTMKSAAGWGELATVQFLQQHASERQLLSTKYANEMLHSCLGGYTLLHTETELRSIRDVIDHLLHMKENAPDQTTVDTVFRQVGWGRIDMNFAKIMLMDRQTRNLRGGLRPSNEAIRDVLKTCYDVNTREFLESLAL